MIVKDVMSSKVLTVTHTDTALAAAQLMSEHEIGAIPVVDDDKLCGIVTDRDIVLRCVASGQQANCCKICDVMSKSVATINPNQSLAEAVRMMSSEQVRRLPVVDQGKLEGIVSLADIARIRSTEELAEALTEISMP